MIARQFRGRCLKPLLACALGFLLTDAAEGQPAGNDPPASSASTTSKVEQLKQTLADQQRQIDELRQALSQQNGSGSAQPVAAAAPQKETLPQAPPPSASDVPDSPLQLRIGGTYITPVGFMDLTDVYRSVTTGAGIGSNFGSIPYANPAAAAPNLSENRLSIQNSRIGMRLDSDFRGAHVLAYWESDFLGFVPTNASVTSNSYNLRERLYWADIRKGKFEMLGGQSWSMMTPNRVGISALPGDLLYSVDMDTNYQLGLTWARQAGVRFLYHPTEKVTFGLSFENSEQYIGGSGGGSSTILPASLTGLANTQLDNGNSTLSVPNTYPDIIAKLAFDPSRKFHLELIGLERTFKVYNPSVGVEQHFSQVGGGGSINLSFDLFKGFKILTNNFYSDGGGRYVFGEAPDLALRPNGSISLVHTDSTVSGFEWTAGNTLIYGYYGALYVSRDSILDSNGKFVGYGYPGSSNSQNRAIQEPTFGVIQTFWKDPRYGMLSLITQYSYLTRDPWAIAAGTPSKAHANMAWVDLRYTLPGAAPTIGR
jgi:hypothetical protein